MVTTAKWIAGNGDWFNAANWSEPDPTPPPDQVHAVPGAGNDVDIVNTTGSTEAVSFDGVDTVNSLSGDAGVTLDLNGGSLTVATGGTFDTLNLAAGATFAVDAGVQTFRGGTLLGTIGGGGTVQLTGTAILASSLTTLTLHGGIQIDPGAWALLEGSIAGYGAITVNAGTLEVVRTVPGQISEVDGIFGNTGTLSVDSGVRFVLGAGTQVLGGVIWGAGTLEFAQFSNVALDNAKIQVANIAIDGGTTTLGTDLTYGGLFELNGGALALAGHTITLNGVAELIGGTIVGDATGLGTIKVTGIGDLATSIGSGGNPATLEDAGDITQISNVSLNGQIIIDKFATYEIADGVSLTGQGGSVVVDFSQLNKASGSGIDVIATDFSDYYSVIQIAGGRLQFNGANNSFTDAVTGAGAFVIGGGGANRITDLTVGAGGFSIIHAGTGVTASGVTTCSGNFKMANTTTLYLSAGQGNAALNIGGTASFLLGSAGAPTVTGDAYTALTLNGGGTIAGLTVGGAAQIINNGGGTLSQTGSVTIGDADNEQAFIENFTGATYAITTDVGIQAGNAEASFLNAGGTLIKSGGTGTSVIGVTFDGGYDTATVEVASGTLDFAGTVSGPMHFFIDAGRTLEFDTSVGNGSAVSFNGSGGHLLLADAQDFAGTLSGFGAGQTLDLRSIAFGTGTTLGYSGNGDSGVLTVSDGTHTANLALLGQYSMSEFQKGADGSGGTAITFAGSNTITLAKSVHG